MISQSIYSIYMTSFVFIFDFFQLSYLQLFHLYIIGFVSVRYYAGYKFGSTSCIMGQKCTYSLHLMHLSINRSENISYWMLWWTDMLMVCTKWYNWTLESGWTNICRFSLMRLMNVWIKISCLNSWWTIWVTLTELLLIEHIFYL